MDIKSVLRKIILSEGHTWVSESLLREYMLSRYKSDSISEINSLIAKHEVASQNSVHGAIFTLPDIMTQEKDIASHLIRIMNAPKKITFDVQIEAYIDRAEKELGIQYHSQQREAIRCAAKHNLFVLNGGPGTGKTSVIQGIQFVLHLLNRNATFGYAAPTGKAAKRITESSGFSAVTTHSLLNLKPLDAITGNEPLNFVKSLILTIDEVSMLDTSTAHALFHSIQSGYRIILVGDIDQLPSVGPGAVLRDIIASHIIPVVTLTKTFRQEGSSDLADNIQRIKKGDTKLVSGDDFRLITPVKYSAKELLIASYLKEVKRYGVDDVLCLTPFRKCGDLCSNEINKQIQHHLNPNGNFVKDKFSSAIYRSNDPVLQLQNRDECVNGDVGKVIQVYNAGIRVRYANSEVDYTTSELSQISLAYAMSIHKSQGSEAKSVVTTIQPEHARMMSRNLLYTGITRAKSVCTLISDPATIEQAINNEATSKRITGLTQMIRYNYHLYQLK